MCGGRGRWPGASLAPGRPLLCGWRSRQLLSSGLRRKEGYLGLQEERPPTLRHYLEILWRRKWILVQPIVVVPLLAVLVSVREPALYQASAQVLLRQENLAANLSGVDDPTQFSASRIVVTQTELARVPEVARRALQAAGLSERSPSDLLGASNVSSADESDILTFSVRDSRREYAARLATEYARAFTDYRHDLDTRALRSAREATEERIARLEATGDTESPLYANLVEHQQQLEALETLQTSRAILVRPATGAAQIEPRPVRNGTIGVVLGLLLGVALAFLGEALDTRVRSADKVGNRLGLPLLARLPQPPRPLRRKTQLAMLAEPNGPHAEAFRVLAANFDLVNYEAGARTIMVTSAVEEEGKSTTVCNLALALAHAGRRVGLVDLDLRNASLHRFFDLEVSPGLTDVVLQRVPLEQAIWKIEIGRPNSFVTTNGATRALDGTLEVLPAGTLPSNVGEFVAGLVLGPIFEQLLQSNDLVLIDGPPLLGLGDAVAVSSQVDALVLVARLDVVRDTMLDDLDRILRASPPTTARLGFIATGAKLDRGYGYMTYAHKRQRAGVSRGDQPG